MSLIEAVPGAVPAAARPGRRNLLAELLATPGRNDRLTHVRRVPARPGLTADWPAWVPPAVLAALQRRGCSKPWLHQVEAAEAAWRGQSVVVATGTGSGKTLAFQLPALSALLGVSPAPGLLAMPPPRGLRAAGGTVLYLSPTKALAADQLRSIRALDLPVHAAAYDGDTPTEERDLVRCSAAYVLTNPDMLHASMLPGHARWADFFRRLRYVVVDECHTYRGVFGSHVAAVLRRLRRICAHYGSEPAFLLASATAADPAESAERLTGIPALAVTADTSPRGARTIVLWEPPLTEVSGQHGAPVRRTATAECADLLADLTAGGNRSLAFVRSRRAAESVAGQARRLLGEIDSGSDGVANRVAAYRGGYLPEERRALERDLRSGRLLGVATTNALELGVDLVGLDAVLIAGWPGTRASFWQQAGRAGRAGEDSLVVLIGRDDPLDTYLVHNPEAIFGRTVEATVFDHENPYVLAPHLCAAAAELPLGEADLDLFGITSAAVVDTLVQRGALRRRSSGWYWTRRERAAQLADLRGSGGAPVRIAERGTGRLLGTVDAATAPAAVHAGAVYVHQGETYVVEHLDLDGSVALAVRAEPEYTTSARSITDIRILETLRSQAWGEAEVAFGTVDVTSQVVAFRRLAVPGGEVLGEEPLDLPPRDLRTRAVWWSLGDAQLAAAGLAVADVPGAAHAAEHASIGLLPLFATCDRWDIGGVSTTRHVDTDRMTVFVYDGAAGGAGFAERGYADLASWLAATRNAIGACECATGCPSCVQSPKCGSGNDPLDKQCALRLLDTLLAARPQ